MIWLYLFLISFAMWLIVMKAARRSVQSGFLLLLSILLLGIFMFSWATSDPEWFSEHLLFHLLLDLELILLAAILIVYPLVLGLLFLVGGVIILKREGLRFTNVLSVGLALALLLFDIVIPWLFDVMKPGILTYIYWYMTLISLYFIFQLASFGLAGLLNTLHIKKDQHLDYVVVLGCAVRGEKLTPLLKSRVDKGISVYRDNPGSKLIMSGGQGDDEPLPEGRAMALYAISVGVPSEDVISEEQSRSTEENLLFSSRLMVRDKPRFALVTSSYHVMRSLLIARRLKLSCIGYGARTKLYFALNAFLREYAGYFRDSRKKRLLHLSLITALYMLFLLTFPG